MNSYRKHYLEHLKSKKKKSYRKKTLDKYFKSYFKYYLFFFFTLTSIPLLYTDTRSQESFLLRWVEESVPAKSLSPVKEINQAYAYPDLTIREGGIRKKLLNPNLLDPDQISRKILKVDDANRTDARDFLEMEEFFGKHPLSPILGQKTTGLNAPEEQQITSAKSDIQGSSEVHINNLPHNFPQNFPEAESMVKTTEQGLIENSEFSDDLIALEDIGDLVDENEQALHLKSQNPYQEIPLKERVMNHQNHRIKSGESLWSIARRYGVSLDSIITLNKISVPHQLQVNDQLRIPQLSGVYHWVKKNESLIKIAKKYKSSVDQIKEHNVLDGFLNPGDVIFLPRANLPQVEKDYLFGNIFIKPVRGILTSKYGVRIHPIKKRKIIHTGIDIAKNFKDKVKSAAEGVVTFASYQGAYGNKIVIQHPHGYETVYAHLNKMWVKRGQRVKKGQLIGLVGNTGLSTGPHLHFEVKHLKKYVNPLRFIKI